MNIPEWDYSQRPKESIIAFIDILGFKNLVRSNNFSKIHDALEALHYYLFVSNFRWSDYFSRVRGLRDEIEYGEIKQKIYELGFEREITSGNGRDTRSTRRLHCPKTQIYNMAERGRAKCRYCANWQSLEPCWD